MDPHVIMHVYEMSNMRLILIHKISRETLVLDCVLKMNMNV